MSAGARAVLIRVLVALLLAALVAVGVQSWRLARAHERHAATALRADSLEAAADSTHHVALSERAARTLLGDSLAAVERRSIQVRQDRDALDRALGRERVALVEARATIAALTAAGSGPVTSDAADSVRRLETQIREPPYTVSLWAALPRAPSVGRAGVTVTVDSARLTLRLQCAAPRDGIRPATAVVTAPSWLSVGLERVTQDPEVCRSPALAPPPSRWGLTAGVGYGVLYDRERHELRDGPVASVQASYRLK